MPVSDASAPSIADRPLQTGASPRLAGLSASLEALFDAERDQLPLWLPVGLGAGIGAWFAFPGASAWAGFILAALAVAAGLLGFAARTRWGRALAIFCFIAALGCALIWLRSDRQGVEPLASARMAAFESEIEAVRYLPARQSVRLVLRPIGAPGLPDRVRINIDEKYRDSALRPGARVKLRAWLMPPAPMAVPGAYDFARHAWFEGIGATGRALGGVEIVTPSPGGGWLDRVALWRQSLGDHIRARLGGDAGAVAVSLATGDQAGISDEDAEAMRRSGLAHLLSISGLHITAAVGAAMLLTLKLLALSPTLALRLPLVLIAAGAAALVGIAYTLLAGAEFPTVRSCVAALLVLAAIGLGRDAFTLRLVAVGALVVLLFWPEALANPSFQMSFAAITAIVALHEHPRAKALLSRREEGLPAKIGRFLLGLLLTGLAVEIALAPIGLFHFHKAGVYGALANILAIPLTTFVIMPLEAAALLLDILGLGAPFWWLAGAGIDFVLALAHFVAEAPGSVSSLPSMPRSAFALMAAGGLWIALWHGKIRRWGVLPLAAGAAWALATPSPDLLVTSDGRHMALRTADGRMALLRGRAGDYVRDTLSETAGYDDEMLEIALLPQAACSADLCAAEIVRDGRSWRILATRSSRYLDFGPMARACAGADIVVSDRRLPRTCAPRWLKADRAFLAQSGGLTVTFGGKPVVSTVADRVGRHPWHYSSGGAAGFR